MANTSQHVTDEVLDIIDQDPASMVFIGRHFIKETIDAHFEDQSDIKVRELTDEDYVQMADHLALAWDKAYLFEQIREDITEFAESKFR